MRRFTLALPPRRLLSVERSAVCFREPDLVERLAALAAAPRDLGLPARSSRAGELLRRARVLRVEPRTVDFVAPAVVRVVRLPLARFAPVLFAFVRLAISPPGGRRCNFDSGLAPSGE